MTYVVTFTAPAIRQMRGIQKKDQQAIFAKVKAYAADPTGAQHDVKRLVGRDRDYRLRSGDYRVIFTIEAPDLIVIRVMHRREVYR